MADSSNKPAMMTKLLRALGVGYVVLWSGWITLALGAGCWESFYPLYQLPKVASGLKYGAYALGFLALSFGVAFGRYWARWLSIAIAALAIGFSALMFWDGYLRIKPSYTGEESSEVFMALIFSSTSVCVLIALCLPSVRDYFNGGIHSDQSNASH
jgi:hypothetical protein